ncbi:hypothetical protein OG871_39470 (plasmid) [Kitasatospora sp. NBC_00374]|uniref:hypothetical protein n=1 Tax=Kitasatospora sp. NBC_00374 TaxID=2975964 RepID=UPI002F911618
MNEITVLDLAVPGDLLLWQEMQGRITQARIDAAKGVQAYREATRPLSARRTGRRDAPNPSEAVRAEVRSSATGRITAGEAY